MKKSCSFLLALLLMLPACAHAQSFAFAWNDPDTYLEWSVLIDENGRQLTDPFEYGQIYPLDKDGLWFAANPTASMAAPSDSEAWGAKIGLMNAEGKMITDPVYTYLYTAYPDRFIYARIVGKQHRMLFGILDTDGNELIAPHYIDLVADGRGGFFATKGEETDSYVKLCHLTHDGIETETGLMTESYIYPSVGNPYAAIDPTTGKRGFIDSNMEWVVPPVYDDVSNYSSEGIGVVGLDLQGDDNMRYGAIDRDGKLILPCAYNWIYEEGGYIFGSHWDEDGSVVYEVYTLEGSLVLTTHGSVSVYGDYFICWPSDGSGTEIMDHRGNVLRKLENTEDYFSGFTPDSEDAEHLLFYYDRSSGLTRLLSDPFTPIGDSYYTMYGCEIGGKTYIIAGNGVVHYDNEYGYWDCDYTTMRYGLLDSEGNVVMPLKYRYLYQIHSSDYLYFEDGSGCGAMDLEQNVLFYHSYYENLMD